MAAPALELRSVHKRFGDVVALQGASLVVPSGTLHMLLGENGAGKTTLLRIAAGFLRPDQGELFVGGTPIQWRTRAAALRAGVAAVEQHFSLVPEMTVAENVSLAASRPFSRFDPQRAAERVRRLASATGLPVEPEARVGSLTVAAQQRAEILKALASDAPLLILDEPTAVLSPGEGEELFKWLRSFVASGKTAVVITHRIREAMTHGDALTVLREGRTALTAATRELSQEQLLAAIMGTRHPATRPPVAPRSGPGNGEPVAVLRDVSVVDESGVSRLRGVNLELRRGEIVGVAGVEGSGQRELLRVLSGRCRPTSGSATLPARCGFIPEDRLRDAIIGEMSLTENRAIRGLGVRAGIIDWKAEAEATASGMAAFYVRAHDTAQPAATLSGGNQQKFVLFRELGDDPPLIVAESPVRGLDVYASAAVLSRLGAARAVGSTVVMYSSDLEDLIGFADRILVCFAGTVSEVANNFEAAGTAMLGLR
jgi:simple sugar transport system ATP-binding protein